MNRRKFIEGAGLAAAGAFVPLTGAGQITVERSYNSPTITVQLAEEQPGRTTVLLLEHGDADECVVEAYYWTTMNQQRLLLHREATAPLVKDATVAADLPMAVTDIVFIKVKEMKLLKQTQFGKQPE